MLDTPTLLLLLPLLFDETTPVEANEEEAAEDDVAVYVQKSEMG